MDDQREAVEVWKTLLAFMDGAAKNPEKLCGGTGHTVELIRHDGSKVVWGDLEKLFFKTACGNQGGWK